MTSFFQVVLPFISKERERLRPLLEQVARKELSQINDEDFEEFIISLLCDEEVVENLISEAGLLKISEEEELARMIRQKREKYLTLKELGCRWSVYSWQRHNMNKDA